MNLRLYGNAPAASPAALGLVAAVHVSPFFYRTTIDDMFEVLAARGPRT